MNIVPKQGGNRFSGLAFVSGFSEKMLSDNFTPELQARGATQPTPVVRVYDVNTSAGGPIVQGQTLVFGSFRVQGCGRTRRTCSTTRMPATRARGPTCRTSPDPRSPIARGRTTRHASRGRFRRATRSRVVGRAACLPQLHGHDIADRLAQLLLPHLAGGRRPRRVQPAAHPAGAVDLAGHQPAAPRSRYGTTYYEWGGKALENTPTRIWCRW